MKKKHSRFRGTTVLLITLLAALASGCPDGTTNSPVRETYTVSYDGNGAVTGSVPVDTALYGEGDSVTVLDNTGNLGKTDFSFTGWNTAADGSGTAYSAGSTFAMEAADTTLYAQWLSQKVTLAISIPAENGYTREQTFTVSFLFNKDVTGFDSSDIIISNGTLSGLTGSGKTYSATVTADAEGAVVITAADKAATADNGYSSELTAYTVHYDITAPATVTPVITAIGGGKLTMIWNEPTDDPSFDHVLVSYDDSPQVKVDKGTTSYTFSGLSIGESYCPLIYTVDAAGNTTEYPGEGLSEYMEDDVFRTLYHVKNASDLTAMANDLNGYYIINNTIDLQDISSWTPIGTESAPFTGIISGGNSSWSSRRITNMKVSAGNYRGLLGYASSAYIHNIELRTSSIAVADGNQYCGLLAGYMKNSRVIDTWIEGSVGSGNYGSYIGGVAGFISGTTIDTCTAFIDVKGNQYCGGITGATEGNSAVNLAGVISSSSPGLSGAVGIAGLVGLAGSGTLAISESYIYMNISSASEAAEKKYAAGLCAINEGSLIIHDCFAMGNVSNTGGSYTGGLIGYGSGSVTCTNSYCDGVITGGTGTGGLYGYIEGPAVTSGCFFSPRTGQTSVKGDINGDGVADGNGEGELYDSSYPGYTGSMNGIVAAGGWSTDIWNDSVFSSPLLNNNIIPF